MDMAVSVLDACDSISARGGAGVVPQLRRSIVSVPSNIAEGYGRPAAEQLTFLRHGGGSLREAGTQIELLARRGRLKAETVAVLLAEEDELGRILHGYVGHVRRSR